MSERGREKGRKRASDPSSGILHQVYDAFVWHKDSEPVTSDPKPTRLYGTTGLIYAVGISCGGGVPF